MEKMYMCVRRKAGENDTNTQHTHNVDAENGNNFRL